jgi:phosphate:Na+ symporter
MISNMDLSPVSSVGESIAVPIGLSIFHTTFNILNVLLLVWFVPLISRTVIRMQPSKGDADEEFHLEHIGVGLMQTAELSVLEANKEVEKFGKVTARLFDMIPQLLQETDSKKFTKILVRIRKYEDITDRMEVEIADYLAKAAQGEMSDAASRKVRSMLSIINDMERIGDICYQLSITFERKSEKKAYFIPELRTRLEEMITEVQNAIGIMNKNLCSDYSQISITDANEAEQMINKMRDELRKEYLKKIETGEFKIQTGLIYNNIIHSLEKVGDHVYNISEAIEESR